MSEPNVNVSRGRPTLYRSKYCKEIVEFCAEGFSITGFAGSIGVNRDTISEWASSHPEFSVALKNAKSAATFSLEKDARRIRQKGAGPGTATMVIFGLKNFAPDEYSDNRQSQQERDLDVNDDAPTLAPDERLPSDPVL